MQPRYTMERKHWIDLLRGICMLAILLFHTDVYCANGGVVEYKLYVSNALVLFFTLSGYLMYKEQEFCLRKKLLSIARGILLPYFIFTLLMAIPKALVHGNEVNIANILVPILSGKASWFVATLCLAEILFSVMIRLSNGKTTVLGIMCIVSFVVSMYIPESDEAYFWETDNALQALLFLFAGYFYHKHEHIADRYLRTPYSLPILFILLVAIKVYECRSGVHIIIFPIRISNYVVFLADMLVGSLFLIYLCKKLPACKWIEWVGTHSLVYYFVCGGVPLLIGKLFEKAGLTYKGNYAIVLLGFVVVCLVSTCIVWFIYRYLPFMTGKKLKKE